MSTESTTHIPALERHYSVPQIASLWGVCTDTVIAAFENEPGVLRFGSAESRRKRKKITMRIPESVMIRVHHERTNKPR